MKLFNELRKSLEANSVRLKGGRAFLPGFLEKRKLVNRIFPPVAKRLARRSRMFLRKEVGNAFPDDWEVGKRQIVDYVLGDPGHPLYFFELESIDRAQLYLFLTRKNEKIDDSKLWYYWGTVCKKIVGDKAMPRYFVFLLVLPDEPARGMPMWDIHYAKLFDRDLRRIIESNPFSFYDRMIKTAARLFIQKETWLTGKGQDVWVKGKLSDYQDICELVIFTVTGRQLIMSRGRDGFDPAKERTVLLRWNTNGTPRMRTRR